jgi:hypothetical protein
MSLQSNADLRLLNGYHISGFLTVDFLQGGVAAPRPTPNLEDQVSIFISPGDWVAQLYPQALVYCSVKKRNILITVDFNFLKITRIRVTPIFKKGDRKDCNRYRGNGLLTSGYKTQPNFQRINCRNSMTI